MSKPKLYLSGSIEYAKDPESWREKMYKTLHNCYKVVVPIGSPCPFEKTDPEYKLWIKDKFIMPDMGDVATSTYVFVKLDPAVFKGAGTISEISLACWLGKHIVVMLDGIELKDMPGWTLGCLEGALFVNNINEAIELYKSLQCKKEK